jgi:thiosulfate dehydrogenase
MLRGLILGILLGVLLVFGGIYFYFATGRAPVAVTAPEMPMERKMAHMALDAYLEKLPHPEPAVPADETNFVAGANMYVQNCAVCHGLPGEPKSNIAEGMAPRPPKLFDGTGVTDDEPWETYWKVENGIRMTGMPGFKGRLSETQIWQVAVLVKNADKISDKVKAALLSNQAGAAGVPVGSVAPAALPVVPPQH